LKNKTFKLLWNLNELNISLNQPVKNITKTVGGHSSRFCSLPCTLDTSLPHPKSSTFSIGLRFLFNYGQLYTKIHVIVKIMWYENNTGLIVNKKKILWKSFFFVYFLKILKDFFEIQLRSFASSYRKWVRRIILESCITLIL
jgi:hypothetical protein